MLIFNSFNTYLTLLMTLIVGKSEAARSLP